jgi:hypothetical protein
MNTGGGQEPIADKLAGAPGWALAAIRVLETRKAM